MQALTAIAATAYALTLWMFAPRTVWEREVKQAKQNQNRLTSTPEMTPQPETETIDTSKTELKSTQKAILQATPQLDVSEEPEASAQPSELTPQPEITAEPEAIPEAIEQLDATPENNYTGWTTTQLRELAKQRKLNWRPLINGKRKPLNKPQLIELLTA